MFVSVVPPDEPVIEGSPEILLTAGVPYNMSCVSRGAKPASVIEWQKDGLPIEGTVSTTVRHTPAKVLTRLSLNVYNSLCSSRTKVSTIGCKTRWTSVSLLPSTE